MDFTVSCGAKPRASLQDGFLGCQVTGLNRTCKGHNCVVMHLLLIEGTKICALISTLAKLYPLLTQSETTMPGVCFPTVIM